MMNAGNGGAEAWRELPTATSNDAVGKMTVGMRDNARCRTRRTNEDNLNVDTKQTSKSASGSV